VQSSVRVVIPARKNAVASSSCVEAELPEWFGFSPSPSPEPAIDNEDNENTPRKRAKISNPATQVAVDTLWVLLLLMRTKMHRVLGFLTEFQVHAKIAKAYLASQQKEMEEMEMVLERL